MKPPPVPDREPVAGGEERVPMRRARELVPRRFHCCCFSFRHSFPYSLGRELLEFRPPPSIGQHLYIQLGGEGQRVFAISSACRRPRRIAATDGLLSSHLRG